MKIIMAAIAACIAVAFVNPAQAKLSSEITQFCGTRYCAFSEAAPKAKTVQHHSHTRRNVKRTPLDANGNRGIITVDTAANIPIRIAPDFAAPIEGVISDLVASGIQPKRIHCFATHGHVSGSRHYSGHACDFDFYAGCMGCSARWTRHIHAIIVRHGLRDGCQFGDCGHIDDGKEFIARHRHPKVAVR